MKKAKYTRENKAIDKEMQKLSTTMEQVHTVKNESVLQGIYYNPSDKAFLKIFDYPI